MTLEPQFPRARARAGHYESIYLVANHPSEPIALWIRYTVRKPPCAPATGSVWFTLFGPDGPLAAKVSAADPVTDGDRLLAVGSHGAVRPDGAAGTIDASGVRATWQLGFEPVDGALRHLPYAWLYRSPVPRTKSTSPYPSMRVTGTVAVGDHLLELDGWPGMLGHNWGAEHAHRWIWLRGASFARHPGTWLDVVIGRIKVGPVLVPWIANGVLCHDGQRHRVGGLGRRVDVRERADGAGLVLPGRDLTLTVVVDAPLAASVGWQYADPAGGQHRVRNCSTAALTVDVRAREGRPLRLTTEHGGVYELGGADADPELLLQPFPDD